MQRCAEIKVLRLGEEDSGLGYLGIVHGNVYMYSTKHNLDTAKKYIMFAEKYNVRILILPYMQPHGPIIWDVPLKEKRRVKSAALSIFSPYFHQLSIVTRNRGIDLVIPGFIEKAGPRLFIAGITIPALPGRDYIRVRKKVVSLKEQQLGISPSKKIEVLNIDPFRIGIIYEEEIKYPELLRIITMMNTSFLIYCMSPNNIIKNYTSMLKTMSYIFGTWIIHIGGLVYNVNRLYYKIPTLISNSDGDIILHYSGLEPALILVPPRMITGNPPIKGEIELIVHQYMRYVVHRLQSKKKKREGHGRDRKSRSNKNE